MTTPLGRLTSLDNFRGFTVASMIVVNSSGYIPGAYAPLIHASWHGWTFADTIFPVFLWIVGFSLTLSTEARAGSGENRRQLVQHALRRALALFAFGLILQPLPLFAMENVHVTGVLQKIAVCYLVVFLLYRHLKIRGLVVCILGLQSAYLGLMFFYPIPGCTGDHWTRQCNVISLVNQFLQQSSMWFPPNDPDGVVTILPATTTALLGVISGRLFRRHTTFHNGATQSVLVGCVLVLCGELLASYVPINKQLWTTPYVLVTGGVASIGFGTSCWLTANKTLSRWMRPFEILGRNAIAAYALSILGTNILKVHVFGISLSEVLLRYLSPANASLLYAIANVAGVYGAIYYMHRRGWHLKL